MSELDRRDYYRMEDQVHLIRTPLEKHLISEDPYSEQYNIPRQALLISQLQAIDNDSRDLLRQVGDYNRPLGTYLKSLDEKIDLLAKYVVEMNGIPFFILPMDESTVYNGLLELLYLEKSDLKKLDTAGKLDRVADTAMGFTGGRAFKPITFADGLELMGPVRNRNENRPV